MKSKPHKPSISHKPAKPSRHTPSVPKNTQVSADVKTGWCEDCQRRTISNRGACLRCGTKVAA